MVALRALDIPTDRVVELCRRKGIRRFSLFGSVLRANFGPESDVDVLVEFEPGVTPGFGFFAIERELADLLGRRVDLNTPMCLSRYFRDEVLQEARAVYDAACLASPAFRVINAYIAR